MRTLDAVLNTDAPPFCPRCGGTDGYLGTQGAYFVCKYSGCVAMYSDTYPYEKWHPNGALIMYWCCDKYGWGCNCAWPVKVKASPFGRA